MNFSPFGNHFQTSLPSMHQFTTKFSDPVIVNTTGVLSGHNAVMVTTLAGDGSPGSIQYLPVSTTNNSNIVHTSQVQGATRLTSLSSNIQVMNSPGSGSKYSPGTIIGWENVPMHHFTAVDPKVVSVPYTQPNMIQSSSPPSVWPVRLINAAPTGNTDPLAIEYHEPEPQDLCKGVKEEKEIIKNEKNDEKVEVIQIPIQAAAWQDATGTTVADYLSRLPPASIPLSLHHFLKYSTSENVKKEGMQELTLISEHQLNQHNAELEHPHHHHHHHHSQENHHQQEQQHHEDHHEEETTVNPTGPGKRKKKKQKIKVKKPKYRPGEIRLSTALDGSTLFCCPECHMAYPERFSLEQHLSGHKLERRFVCDVCGAGLKRKEHLDQHKRGHSQERPFVCSICLKGFKRNEHLTRHYVIHSGDKSHVCGECGKAFSRKDHLHKHAQTHIAKKVKAELSQQSMPSTPSLPVPAPIMS